MGLSLRKLGDNIRDIFDANTQADQQRRLAAGQPRFYGEQQAQLPANQQRPINLARRYFAPSFKSTFGNPTNYRDAAVGLGRGFARIPEQASRSFSEAISGQELSAPGATDPVRRFLYGSEPLETYQQRAEGYKKTLEGSRFRNFAGPLSGVGGFAMAASDIAPGGKGKPRVVAKNVPKQVAMQLDEGAKAPSALPKNPDGTIKLPPPQVGKTDLPTVTKAEKPVAGKKVKPTILESVNYDDPLKRGGGRLSRIRSEAGSLVDEDAGMIRLLKDIEKETGQKGLVDDWYFNSGNIRTSNAMANAGLMRSPELRSAIGGLSKKELKELDDYAIARAESRNYKGLKTSTTKKVARENEAAGRQKYGERYKAMNAYYKNLANDLKDAGLISSKKHKEWSKDSNYIRIQRNIDDILSGGQTKSQSRSIKTTKASQKRTGSKREALSPTRTLAQRTQDLQLEIARNKAANDAINVLEKYGLATPTKTTGNKNTIGRLVDGKTQLYEVHRDIKEVVENLNPYHLGILAKILSAPTRLIRAGTTALSAPFAITNFARDQLSSAIVSKNAVATHGNPLQTVAALGSAMKDFGNKSNNALWMEFEKYAGNQTIFDELRNASKIDDVLREIRLGQKGKSFNQIKNPVRTLEDLVGITEKATRFQNFQGIYKAARKEGLGHDDAVKRAVLAARQNSVDFNRGSPFTRTANLFIPYFNAGVQGSRTVVRGAKERPAATMIKATGLLAMPMAAAIWYNNSSEERKKVYDSIDEIEKANNIIIVGDNPEQKDDGTWVDVYKIPKPHGYREFLDPFRVMVEGFVKDKPVDVNARMFADMLSGLTGPVQTDNPEQFIGSVTPQQIKPVAQWMLNRDLYSGKTTLPEYMTEETDDPAKQKYDGTSGTAARIAGDVDQSPIKVEKFIKDTSGSLGLYGLNLSDNIMAKAGVFGEDEIGGRSAIGDVKRRIFEATGDLLEEKKSSGRKYFEDVDSVLEDVKLNKNEDAAWRTIHPQKTNFLDETIFDENKRMTKLAKANAYLQFPKVFEADKKIDQLQRNRGKPGNPLFDLPKDQLSRVLWKDSLPPGAKDPELSNLWRSEWYQDYRTKRTQYFEKVKESLKAEGKELPKSDNPYPEATTEVKKAVEYYSSLPKGTGARSGFIKANPDLWNKMTAQWQSEDVWENGERMAVGLSAILKDESGNTIYPYILDDGSSFGKSGSGGGGGGSSPNVSSAYRFAVSRTSGGSPARPTVSAKSAGSTPSRKSATARKPKVTIKKSLV